MAAYLASVLVAFAPHPACAKTYTVPMAQRAAVATYAGTRTVTAKDRRHLARFLRCQRNLAAKGFVRWFYAQRRRLHAQRVAATQMAYARVSWYDDNGPTASGWHAAYGVAVCGSGGGPCLRFGSRIQFCYRGCVTAVADDHGPYVPGRAFDLAQSTAGAIGFSGVGEVKYRIDR